MIEKWWETVKDSDYWSGAIVGLGWDDLWPEAQEEIRQIGYKLLELKDEK